ADRVDTLALAQHRAEREAAMKKSSGAMVQAIFDVHDALTPPQRRTLADWMRAQKAEHAGGKFGPELFKRMIFAHIDEALEAAKLTPAQVKTAHAARDRLFQAFEDVHRARDTDMERALALFTADKLDAKAIDALHAEHLAQMRKTGDAV